MKSPNLKLLFILLTMTFLIISCDDDDDENNGATGNEYITAKIDRTNFEASKDPATIIGATISNGLLAVQGGDNSGNTISFQIFGYSGVGTYKTGDALSSTNQIMYITITPTVATWSSSGVTSVAGITPGTIEVTSDDGTTVEGTFTFEGYNGADKTSKNITNGMFKAVLQ